MRTIRPFSLLSRWFFRSFSVLSSFLFLLSLLFANDAAFHALMSMWRFIAYLEWCQISLWNRVDFNAESKEHKWWLAFFFRLALTAMLMNSTQFVLFTARLLCFLSQSLLLTKTNSSFFPWSRKFFVVGKFCSLITLFCLLLGVDFLDQNRRLRQMAQGESWHLLDFIPLFPLFYYSPLTWLDMFVLS